MLLVPVLAAAWLISVATPFGAGAARQVHAEHIDDRGQRLGQVQRAMELDLMDGLAWCDGLSGRQKLACEARAVATARAPQGRLGRSVSDGDGEPAGAQRP
jgi:hypothetical protein